nr:PEP-CTERM sorting domain-containing protein [Peristeroidobacter agariperforans]
MSLKSTCLSAALLALSAFTYVQSASATPLLCQEVNKNHMYVDDSQVSSCLGAGVGNINGNPNNDAFLTGEGAGLGLISIGEGDFAKTGKYTGTFSFDGSLWDSWSEIAIGFKFGTGNQADEWFVYMLNPLISSGSWLFSEFDKKGGQGLSHITLYGRSPPSEVPEPGTLALLGVGLLGAGIARRRKQV